jgi:multimeric flavodoxin WrbA
LKKVLGIVGSPRKKGNTSILVSKILEGATFSGAATDTIYLKDLDIEDCIGCLACLKGKECSHKDDMNDLFPKIIESDLLVFGTPVYWYGPTAIMKAFMDRFVYFNYPENRNKIRNKATLIAIPFEDNDLETSDLLVLFFEKFFKYLEMNLMGKILAPGIDKKGEILNKPNYLREGYELGKRLVIV